jgi:hypothetical protein
MEYIKEFEKTEWTKRLAQTQRLRVKHPGRIPMIVDRGNVSTPKPKNHRFLVPLEMEQKIADGTILKSPMTMASFMSELRKNIPTLRPDQSIFIFIYGSNILTPMSAPLSQIYDEHQEKDGFLKIIYTIESTFG